MLALGILLIILGAVLAIDILYKLGIALLIIGAVLWAFTALGRPVGGRRYWF